MRNRFSGMLAILLVLVMAAGSVPALAASREASIVTEKLYSDTGEYYIKLDNWTHEEEILSVTSSNPSVIKVKGRKYRMVLVKNAGRAKITIRYRLKGETHRISAVYTVEEYPSPISKIQVNGKNVRLRKENKVAYEFMPNDCLAMAMVVINLVPNRDWRIAAISAYTYRYDREDVHRTVSVKNNVPFVVAADREAVITYTLRNKGTREKFTYTFRFIRGGE